MDSYNKEKSEINDTSTEGGERKEDKLDIDDLFGDSSDSIETGLD